MATMTLDAESPGRGRQGPVFAFSGRRKAIATATFTFDASYPTGGESIVELTDLFRSVDSVYVSGPASRLYEVDLSGVKKLKLFTAVGTEAANASDQSTIVVRLLAVGVV